MLKWITLRTLRGAAWGLGLAAGIGAFGAWVRLLPWMFARDVPWSVIWPFARVLLASGLELALLIGAPTGWLAGWALALGRGEVRALLALGVGPGQLLWRGLPQLMLIGIVGASAARSLSGSVEGAPILVLSQLVAAGEAHCVDHPASVADVPVAGLVQHCASGRLLGRIPGSRAGWFAVSDVRVVSPTQAQLGASEFLVHGGDDWLRLQAERVRVRGFVAPTSARRSVARAVALASATGCLGLLLLPLLRRPDSLRPMVLGVVGGTSAVVLLTQLDRLQLPGAAYALVTLPPLLVTGIALSLARRCGSPSDCSTRGVVIGNSSPIEPPEKRGREKS